MKLLGFYDRVVGIQYDMADSIKQSKDLWYTDNEFSFYVGTIADQKYITVPKSFITDGATVPRVFWSIFPPWGIYGQAAVLHDYLCTNKKLTKNGDNENLTILQKEIDDIFNAAMRASGTPTWKRLLIYGAVRLYHNLFP